MPRKTKITSWPSLTLCSSDPTPKLKTNMVKLRKVIVTQTKQFVELFSGLRIVLCLKDVKILLRIIVLIVRGCSDQMHGLNKLFLHLMRALLILNYEKPCRIFPYMLLEKFTQLFWTKKKFLNFLRLIALILAFSYLKERFCCFIS